jgi:chromate transport protein ChrA
MNKTFTIVWMAIIAFALVAIFLCHAWWHVLTLLIAVVMTAMMMPKRWKQQFNNLLK